MHYDVNTNGLPGGACQPTAFLFLDDSRVLLVDGGPNGMC
jgi:hypothetical protein